MNVYVNNVEITNKMHLHVYAVFYSQFSHQHISANIAAIFRMILLQEYKGTYVVSCIIVTS